MKTPITIAYTEQYLLWEGSAASPQRARLAFEHISARCEDEELTLDVLDPSCAHINVVGVAEARKVHSKGYVKRVMAGKDAHAPTPEQGRVAMQMFGGTVLLAEAMEADEFAPQVYFNPQGAKHHAMRDRSSGFCVFNDMAWAAARFTAAGKRVAYLDWDAHHGDGVEALTLDNPDVMTISIHQDGIFPGTGKRSWNAKHALNYPLGARAGDEGLLDVMEDALDSIRAFAPDVLLLACGADGLRGDPLSSLGYTIEDGIIPAARGVGKLAADLGIPVLVGGAGGYQPFTYVPIAWAETIMAIHDELLNAKPRKQAVTMNGRQVGTVERTWTDEKGVHADVRMDDWAAPTVPDYSLEGFDLDAAEARLHEAMGLARIGEERTRQERFRENPWATAADLAESARIVEDDIVLSLLAPTDEPESEADRIMAQLENIPTDQWEDHLTSREMGVVGSIIEPVLQKVHEAQEQAFERIQRDIDNGAKQIVISTPADPTKGVVRGLLAREVSARREEARRTGEPVMYPGAPLSDALRRMVANMPERPTPGRSRRVQHPGGHS